MVKQAIGTLIVLIVITLVIAYPLYLLVTEAPKQVVIGVGLTAGIVGLGFFSQSVERWYRISKDTRKKEVEDFLSKS